MTMLKQRWIGFWRDLISIVCLLLLNIGNFYLERVDVSIYDIVGNFEVIRVCNSKPATMSSIFGRGWSFYFDKQVFSDEDQNIYYTRTDGSIIKFTQKR